MPEAPAQEVLLFPVSCKSNPGPYHVTAAVQALLVYDDLIDLLQHIGLSCLVTEDFELRDSTCLAAREI